MTANWAAGLISICVAVDLFLFIATGVVFSAVAAVICAVALLAVCRMEMRERRRQEVLAHFMEISRKARRP